MQSAPIIAPDCPFCRANGLLRGEPIAEASGSYLIKNVSSPGDYLIIPENHIEIPAELPASWWGGVATLLDSIPNLGDHYNLTMNIGKLAGQSVKHLHLWVIPRVAGEPASGKGLVSLIGEVNRFTQKKE